MMGEDRPPRSTVAVELGGGYVVEIEDLAGVRKVVIDPVSCQLMRKKAHRGMHPDG